MRKRNKTARNRGIVIILAVVIIGSVLIWWQPWQTVFPPAVAQPENTATIFQAFFITYQNGETRWYYAPERAVALSIIGIDEVGGIVTKVQTHVFMNVNYDASKTLSNWDFSADGRFMIYDVTNNVLVKDFGVQQVSASGTSLEDNKDVWLTSASMTAADIEEMVSFQSGSQYSFVVELRNIDIDLHFADGSSVEMTALGGTANDLEWRFTYV